MRLDGKRILVTGADGFIGSHLTERLVRRGCDVRAFVQYNSLGGWGWLDESPADIRKDLDVFAGDIRDPHGVRTAMTGCDVVLHLAALIAIPYSYHSPQTYVETNVMGTLNIVQTARDLGVERVVHTSTSEVYGTARFVPITEAHPLQGQSPYSASKIGADQIALSFNAAFGTPVTVIRPFNTYGPRQSARAVIPTILGQLHSGAREIRLGATTPTRDFNYVDDTVGGFLAVAESEQALGQVVNIGSGREIAVGALIELLIEITGHDARVVTDADRVRPAGSEVERLLADITRAREWTDWEPQVPLEEGLRRTSDWIRDHLDTVDPTRYQV